MIVDIRFSQFAEFVKPKILYCRCAFARVVPQETKDAVLEALCDSGVPFETVSDLCEMSARKDPRLAALLAGEEPVKIAACYPRAVKWLFHSAGVDFQALDSNPCRLFFMLGTPRDQVPQYLQILAHLTRLLKNQTFCNELLAAKTQEAVIHVFEEAEK